MGKTFTSTTISPPARIGFTDFIADCRSPRFFFLPTMELWVPEAVNGALGKVGRKKAATVLRETRLASQVTWFPGEPALITDRVLTKIGSWKPVPGAIVLNLYEPPAPPLGGRGEAVADLGAQALSERGRARRRSRLDGASRAVSRDQVQSRPDPDRRARDRQGRGAPRAAARLRSRQAKP
jgi:hypothetical protein